MTVVAGVAAVATVAVADLHQVALKSIFLEAGLDGCFWQVGIFVWGFFSQPLMIPLEPGPWVGIL